MSMWWIVLAHSPPIAGVDVLPLCMKLLDFLLGEDLTGGSERGRALCQQGTAAVGAVSDAPAITLGSR